MTTTALSRREISERSSQLLALMCDWDPIGVMSDPDWHREEYDCLVGPVLTLLAQNANEDDIARYLRQEMIQHFGLSQDNIVVAEVAGRLHRWFDRGWRNIGDPTNIFLALLNEGVDAWRPVQARPLACGHFRIIGVDGDTRDETWQFPVGSIVKCTHREFADGSSGMAAVEQVGDAG
jgi:hypothetical protein